MLCTVKTPSPPLTPCPHQTPFLLASTPDLVRRLLEAADRFKLPAEAVLFTGLLAVRASGTADEEGSFEGRATEACSFVPSSASSNRDFLQPDANDCVKKYVIISRY